MKDYTVWMEAVETFRSSSVLAATAIKSHFQDTKELSEFFVHPLCVCSQSSDPDRPWLTKQTILISSLAV